MQSQNRRKPQQKRKHFGVLRLLKYIVLVILFPIGFVVMWSSRCTWPKNAKYAVSGVLAALLVAVFVLPSPTNQVQGGIEWVELKPSIEIYGPELPTAMVTGYTNQNVVSVFAEESQSSTHYVYAATNADCYHEYDCKFAYASSQRLTVYEAHFLGYDPCGLCNPPIYES